MARSRKKLGDILVGWGAITKEQADQTAKTARASGQRLGDALVEAGLAREEQVAKALANQFGMEFVDLSQPGVADKVEAGLIGDDIVRKHLVLPLSKDNGKLKVIIHDPMDLEMLDMLRFRYSVEVEPLLAAKGQIKDHISRARPGWLARTNRC